MMQHLSDDYHERVSCPCTYQSALLQAMRSECVEIFKNLRSMASEWATYTLFHTVISRASDTLSHPNWSLHVALRLENKVAEGEPTLNVLEAYDDNRSIIEAGKKRCSTDVFLIQILQCFGPPLAK